MKKPRNPVGATIGFVLISGAIALFTPTPVLAQAPEPQSGPSPIPPPLDVKVVNTASAPVPVTGTVNVGNLGSSPLTVQVVNTSSAPAIVAGTVGVTNAASPLNIRDVDNPARNGFTFSASISLPSVDNNTSFLVPVGKRLVIEQVSASGNSEASGLWLQIDTQLGSSINRYRITSVKAKLGVFDVWIASSQMKSYAKSGSTVRIWAIRDNANGTANVSVDLFGYLIDEP